METYVSRKFSKTEICISKKGEICIAGEWFTNWGIIYPFHIQKFKDGVKNPVTGFPIQVIGMDSDISRTHANWIYNKIKRGYFDHLIEEPSYMND
jgi:hypothetical protein